MVRVDLVVRPCAWCHLFPCRCPRTERCACGGWIVAAEGTEPEAVRQHNDTPQHQAWRAGL